MTSPAAGWHQRFRVERDRLGLSQKGLADALGTDQRSVKRWESGVNRPDDYLEKIAKLSPGFLALVEEYLREAQAAYRRVEEIDAEIAQLRAERGQRARLANLATRKAGLLTS